MDSATATAAAPPTDDPISALITHSVSAAAARQGFLSEWGISEAEYASRVAKLSAERARTKQQMQQRMQTTDVKASAAATAASSIVAAESTPAVAALHSPSGAAISSRSRAAPAPDAAAAAAPRASDLFQPFASASKRSSLPGSERDQSAASTFFPMPSVGAEFLSEHFQAAAAATPDATTGGGTGGAALIVTRAAESASDPRLAGSVLYAPTDAGQNFRRRHSQFLAASAASPPAPGTKRQLSRMADWSPAPQAANAAPVAARTLGNLSVAAAPSHLRGSEHALAFLAAGDHLGASDVFHSEMTRPTAIKARQLASEVAAWEQDSTAIEEEEKREDAVHAERSAKLERNWNKQRKALEAQIEEERRLEHNRAVAAAAAAAATAATSGKPAAALPKPLVSKPAHAIVLPSAAAAKKKAATASKGSTKKTPRKHSAATSAATAAVPSAIPQSSQPLPITAADHETVLAQIESHRRALQSSLTAHELDESAEPEDEDGDPGSSSQQEQQSAEMDISGMAESAFLAKETAFGHKVISLPTAAAPAEGATVTATAAAAAVSSGPSRADSPSQHQQQQARTSSALSNFSTSSKRVALPLASPAPLRAALDSSLISQVDRLIADTTREKKDHDRALAGLQIARSKGKGRNGKRKTGAAATKDAAATAAAMSMVPAEFARLAAEAASQPALPAAHAMTGNLTATVPRSLKSGRKSGTFKAPSGLFPQRTAPAIHQPKLGKRSSMPSGSQISVPSQPLSPTAAVASESASAAPLDATPTVESTPAPPVSNEPPLQSIPLPGPASPTYSSASSISTSSSRGSSRSLSSSPSIELLLRVEEPAAAGTNLLDEAGEGALDLSTLRSDGAGGADDGSVGPNRSVSFPFDATHTEGIGSAAFASKLKNAASKPKSPSSSAAAAANLAQLSALEKKAKRAERAEAAAKVRAEIERKRVADMEQVAATSGVTAAAAASASAAAAALALLPPPPAARGSRAPSVIMQSITSPADDHDSIGRRLIALSSYAAVSVGGSANPSPPPEAAEKADATQKDQAQAGSTDEQAGSVRTRRALKLRPAGAPKSFVLPMRSLESKLLNAGIGVLAGPPLAPQSPAVSNSGTAASSPRMGRMVMGDVSQSQLSSSPLDHRSGASTPGGGQRTLILPFSPSFTATSRLSPSPTPTAVAASLSAFMDPGSAAELSHSSSSAQAGSSITGSPSPSSSAEPPPFADLRASSSHSPSSRLFGFSTPIAHLKSLMASNQEMQAAEKQDALIRHMQQEEQNRQQQQQPQPSQSSPSPSSRRAASALGTAPTDDRPSASPEPNSARSTSRTPTSGVSSAAVPSYKGSAPSPVLIPVKESGEGVTRLSSNPSTEVAPASSSGPAATSASSAKKKRVRIVEETLPLEAVRASDAATAAPPAAAPSSVSPPKPSRRAVRSHSVNEPAAARRKPGKPAGDSAAADSSSLAAPDALSRRRSSVVDASPSSVNSKPSRRPRRSFANSGSNLPASAQSKGPPPNLVFASPHTAAAAVEPSLAQALARVTEDNRSPRQRTAFSHQRVDADRYGSLGTATPQELGSAAPTRRSSNVPAGSPVAPSPPLSQRDSGVVDRLLAPIQRRPTRVPSTSFIPVRTDLSEWEHLGDATSSLHASPEIMIRSIDAFVPYDSNANLQHHSRRISAVAPAPPVQVQQIVEPEPEPDRATETEADSELDSDARSTSGRDSANPREEHRSASAAAGALTTIPSPAIQFAIAPQEEITAETPADVLAPPQTQDESKESTRAAGTVLEPNSSVEQAVDAAPADAEASEEPQSDEAQQEQLEMEADEAQSEQDVQSEVSSSEEPQQQQEPAEEEEVDALTLEIIRDLATVAAMPAPTAAAPAGAEVDATEEDEFPPSSVRFDDDLEPEQGDASVDDQPDPIDFRGSPLPPQQSSEEVMRVPEGLEDELEFEQPPPGSSQGKRGRRGKGGAAGAAGGQKQEEKTGYFAAANAAARPSIERGTSRASNNAYTGILDVVQLHARRLARRKIQASKPLVRQLLAEAMERERLARETDEWIRTHADQEAEGWGEGDDDEERKDGSTSPFKPSRANATIMPAATPGGSGAPRVAGSVASRSDRGGEVSAQRAMQIAREQRHAAQAALRAEPRFIAPSSNPLFSREFLATKSNRLKSPLPVHVASASFCFYTTADEAPIQLEFAREAEEYPRRHDLVANQHRAANAGSTLTSPRANRTTIHATSTTTTTTTQHQQQQHTVASYAPAHGSQTARPSHREPTAPESAMPLSASSSPRHPPHHVAPAWSHVDSSAFEGTDHAMLPAGGASHAAAVVASAYRSSVPFHASLPNSPSPVMGRPANSGVGPQPTSAAAAAPAAPSAASLPSVGQLSASLLSHSNYLPSLSVDSRPIFPSFHAFKATLTKKNANVDEQVQQHAQQHLHGDAKQHHKNTQRKAR